MVEQIRRDRRQLVHRFQQDAGIGVEEGADPLQHVGAREALARKIAVVLRPVAPALATAPGDRGVSAAELAQVGAEDAANLDRIGHVSCGIYDDSVHGKRPLDEIPRPDRALIRFRATFVMIDVIQRH